jgi:hypothetical protein
MTLLGGAVHVFRSCLRRVELCAFCSNTGLPEASNLASRGALYIESPECVTNVTMTRFEANVVPLDGGAVQVHHQLPCCMLHAHQQPNQHAWV